MQLARSYGHVNNEYSFLGRPLDRYKSPRSTIFMTIPQAATASYAVYIATRRPAIFLPYHTNPSQISLPNRTILYPMLKIKKNMSEHYQAEYESSAACRRAVCGPSTI